jgi:hypothetical protein
MGEHVDPNRITVRAWLAMWLDAVRAEVAPKTHERYGEIVHRSDRSIRPSSCAFSSFSRAIP